MFFTMHPPLKRDYPHDNTCTKLSNFYMSVPELPSCIYSLEERHFKLPQGGCLF